jgi:hypothetical protein
MSDPIVRPVHNKQCVFQTGVDPAGKARYCPSRATLALNGCALCDKHAEMGMMSECGRNVKIQRGE